MSNANADIILTVSEGLLEKGTQIRVDHQENITVGRTQQNKLVLAENAVSRKHAIVFRRNDQLFLQDLGSKNGSFVNFKKVDPHEEHLLRHGDKIQLGSTVFTLQILEKTHQERSAPREEAASASPDSDSIDPTLQRIETLVSDGDGPIQKRFALPKVNLAQVPKRAWMYGTVALVFAMVLISKKNPSTQDAPSYSPKQTSAMPIEIPDTFATDRSQPTEAPTAEEVEVMMSQAQSAMRYEDYHKAIRLYERILLTRAEDPQVLAHMDMAKQNLYKKIQTHRDIALIEIDKLNYLKAAEHWKRIAELTEGFDLALNEEAQKQIASLEALEQSNL